MDFLKQRIVINYVNLNYRLTKEGIDTLYVMNVFDNPISLSDVYDDIRLVFSLSHNETRKYFTMWFDLAVSIIEEESSKEFIDIYGTDYGLEEQIAYRRKVWKMHIDRMIYEKKSKILNL